MGECARRGSRVSFVAGDETRTLISQFPRVTTDTNTIIALTFTTRTPCEAPAEYMFSAIEDTSRSRRGERPSLPKPTGAGQAG